ncbi:hypothetical protein ACFE04_027627 [Oxalis oulophora]
MWRRVTSLSPSFISRSSSSHTTCSRFTFIQSLTTLNPSVARGGIFPEEKNSFIAFVLGGPGSGKGTQCEKIVDTFGFRHLSAGELLRREIASNGEYRLRVSTHLMLSSKDTMPTFDLFMGVEPNVVLFFDCPEEEMVKRVLNRNQGRIDDNIDTIKKRLKVFKSLNLPVINHYSQRGKLYTVNAVGTLDEIFEKVRPAFATCELSE